MPKWKEGAKEFTVSVTYHEVRGYQTVMPKPVAEHLGRPERVTFEIKRGKVEVRAAHR
jgi:hypothetical protein